ncbi:hypothetical protein TrCOL_g522 [Triparma columacea]|uniref:Uncharacterized protein n=1 Tax=Triparma columacea TaxID=722753 RepID=A0A9W7GPK0_9STRA|nr:hypothetical protein TrCOL_g522 [Triparma columacea]
MSSLRHILVILLCIPSVYSLAGFGASSSKKKSTLRPKNQWDRYIKLRNLYKKDPTCGVSFSSVAISLPLSPPSFLPVGTVGSTPGTPIGSAVGSQKRLIVEHAIRLHPGKITISNSKDVIYGISSIGSTSYTTLSTSDMVKVEEKEVGFEGVCDPGTGFFCKYDGGKIVNGADGDKGVKATGGKKSGEKRTGL